MKGSLRIIAILAVIAAFIVVVVARFLFGLTSSMTIIVLALNLLIWGGFLIVARYRHSKILLVASCALIALTIMQGILSLLMPGSVIHKLFTFVFALFIAMMGIGLFTSRKDLPGGAPAVAILFILYAASTAFAPSLLIFIEPIVYIFSITTFFIISSRAFGEDTSQTDSEIQLQRQSKSRGYRTSLIIALIVATVGAILEAVTGFVTFTLMPDIVFIIANTIYLSRVQDKGARAGAGMGFLNIVIVIILSVIVFVMATALLDGLGWYEICARCNGLGGFG